MTRVSELVADLCAEQADLDQRVIQLQEGDWRRPTPAVGWSIQDQIAHLAFFDAAARLACTDSDTFERRLANLAVG